MQGERSVRRIRYRRESVRRLAHAQRATRPAQISTWEEYKNQLFPEKGQEGTLWDAANTPILSLVPKLTDETAGAAFRANYPIASRMLEETLGKEDTDILAGVLQNTEADILNYTTSPIGLGTLRLGAAPKAVQKVVALAFAVHSLRSMPEHVAAFRKATTFKEKAHAAVALLQAAAISLAAGKHGLSPSRTGNRPMAVPREESARPAAEASGPPLGEAVDPNLAKTGRPPPSQPAAESVPAPELPTGEGKRSPDAAAEPAPIPESFFHPEEKPTVGESVRPEAHPEEQAKLGSEAPTSPEPIPIPEELLPREKKPSAEAPAGVEARPEEQTPAGKESSNFSEPRSESEGTAKQVRDAETYEREISQPGTGKVVFAIGEPGPGKTGFLDGTHDAEIVVDVDHSDPAILHRQIQQAVESGRTVELVHLESPTQGAFIEKSPAAEAREIFLDGFRQFRDNPKVKFQAMESTEGRRAQASDAKRWRPKIIRNQRLAGSVHPVTKIPFDRHGFPDFSNVAIQTVKIKFTGDRYSDCKAANEAAGISKVPRPYTWHHHQDGVTMQLVPLDVHIKTGHTGGQAWP